jgi:chemotaxis protein CheD
MSRSSHHRARKRAAAGLEQIEPGYSTYRYDAPAFGAVAVKVFPGEHYVTSTPNEMPVTVLGSCVAACIRDPLAGIGGMNHFMLPEGQDHRWGGLSASMRYGNVAMERLINEILARGGARHRLEVKVFGGANVMGGTSNIGHRNADFVESYLAAEGIPIAASHLRSNLPRRVHYFPMTGRVLLQELRQFRREVLLRSEALYKSKLRSEPVEGPVELFGNA